MKLKNRHNQLLKKFITTVFQEYCCVTHFKKGTNHLDSLSSKIHHNNLETRFTANLQER